MVTLPPPSEILQPPPQPAPAQPLSKWALDPRAYPWLSSFSRNLTELAAESHLDPAIGREREIEELLDISRITRGKIRLQTEPVDLSKVIARAVETSRPLIDARRHELTVSLPPEPLRVQGDPVRLAQVLGNLLNNAAKYTEPGGRICLTGERDGAEVVARVRDKTAK